MFTAAHQPALKRVPGSIRLPFVHLSLYPVDVGNPLCAEGARGIEDTGVNETAIALHSSMWHLGQIFMQLVWALVFSPVKWENSETSPAGLT